jgi:hypothetical protein
MIREGDTFYWIGYDTGPGRWPWKIHLYSSKNLADWKFERTIIQRSGKFGDINWAGRPGILYNAATKKYVILFEHNSPQYQRHRIGFAAADRIDGPYELVNVQPAEPGRSSGDQVGLPGGGQGISGGDDGQRRGRTQVPEHEPGHFRTVGRFSADRAQDI